MELKIDEEFQALFPPLTPDVFDGLKQDVVRCGKIREPIYTWTDEDGNEVIIDGHNRYRISQETGIQFSTVSMDDELADRNAVIDWMIDTQLNRRNLTPWERSKIALAHKEALAKRAKEAQARKPKSVLADLPKQTPNDTRATLAKQAGVSPRTMGKADALYSSDRDDLKERADHGEAIDRLYKELKGKENEPSQVEKLKAELDDVKQQLVEQRRMTGLRNDDNVMLKEKLDDAEAEADQLREKASAYDDLQQMNHTLREKLREKDEELLNRPERETIVTKEVVPEDYERLKAENASMGKRLAEYEAHTQGLSLQEYAENSEDDDIRQYTKTLDEETAAAKQVRDVLRALECLPSDEAEMRELARCYMDWSVRRDETREDAQNTILRAQRKLDALAEQFGMGPKLKVVK